jgi:hypothetical protein
MTAPDPSLPPDQPALGQSLSVRLGKPQSGCLDLFFDVDGQVFDFRTSYVFDGYPAARDWLARLAEGGEGRVVFNLEGSHLHLIAVSMPDSLVRFAVVHSHQGPGDPATVKLRQVAADDDETQELYCDVILPRSAVVKAFHDAFQQGWGALDDDAFWDGWFNTFPEFWATCYDEPYGSFRYVMTSDVVDQYLAAAEGGHG